MFKVAQNIFNMRDLFDLLLKMQRAERKWLTWTCHWGPWWRTPHPLRPHESWREQALGRWGTPCTFGDRGEAGMLSKGVGA